MMLTESAIADAATWDPRAQPPVGVTFDNLRKRGLDTVRIRTTYPSFALDIVSDGIPLVCIAAGLLVRPQLGTAAVAAAALAFLGYHVLRRWNDHETCEICVSADLLTVTRYSKSGDEIRAWSLSFSEVEDIRVVEGKLFTKPFLEIATTAAPVQICKGLELSKLEWIERQLTMELTGLTWRPLHGIDRRHTRTKGPTITNPVLLKPELAERLIAIFVAEAPLMVDQLRAALQDGMAEDVRMSAHWLKSASANVGATKLSELCQIMEAHGRDNDLDGTAPIFDAIEHSCRDYIDWLQDPDQMAASSIAYVALADDPEQLIRELRSDAPVATSDAVPLRPTDVRVTSPRRFTASVLIVDDSAVCREVAKDYLEDVASEIVVAADGVEALELLKQKPFDLVLMDCEMYGLNGYQCTRRWRSIEGLYRDRKVPIIALTGHALKGDRARCIDAGMDDYLCKPYSFTTLREKVSHWLSAGYEARALTTDQAHADYKAPDRS